MLIQSYLPYYAKVYNKLNKNISSYAIKVLNKEYIIYVQLFLAKKIWTTNISAICFTVALIFQAEPKEQMVVCMC